jgi:hypothetical protein
MQSEIREARGGRYMVLEFQPEKSTWADCLDRAHRQHPGCKGLPCVSVRPRRMADTFSHAQPLSPQQARAFNLCT